MRQRSLAIVEGVGAAPFGEVEDGSALRRSGVASAERGQPRTVLVFLWAFLGVGTMLCAWSIATPIAAAPDEPAHIAQAVAIVRGQFHEPVRHTPLGLIASVRVPAWAGDLTAPCFLKDDLFTGAKVTGVVLACPDHVTDAKNLVPAPTQFANAPPLYYLVVGIPSLFLSGTTALYAMRLVSCLLNAALVALGISLLVRFYPRRTPLAGVLIALTPMVLFLMSVVSSSGLEIASGFATWCGGLCIVEHPRIPRLLAIWTAVAAVLLVLTRPTSPLDAGVIAVVLAFLIGWKGLRQRLNPSLVPLWSSVLVAVLVAAVFLAVFGPPHLTGVAPRHPASLLSNMWTTLKLTGRYLRQCIGDFGWLDTPVPAWIVGVWTACLVGLLALALTLSSGCRRALPVLALLIIATALVVESPQLDTVSALGQGRYWLPVAIGLPLVASTFTWGPRRRAHRHTGRGWVAPTLTLGLGLVLLAAQIASFLHALTRYEVGLHVPSGSPTRWLPPGGHVPVVVAFVLGAVVTLALAVFMMLPRMKAGSESRDDALGAAELLST